ncbi:MAG: hypothetical protein ACOWWM_06695 [Desulfobacterales bacterium]
MQKKTALMSGLAILIAAMALTMIGCTGESGSPAAEVSLRGTVNQENQFVDEAGQTYELSNNMASTQAMAQPGEMLEVKGTLQEQGEQRILTITEFSVIEP